MYEYRIAFGDNRIQGAEVIKTKKESLYFLMKVLGFF